MIQNIYFTKFQALLWFGILFWGGELNTRILRIQKRATRSMVGASTRTSCRQLFKELNILTLASLYRLEVTCFIRKYCQSLEINSIVHNYNTQRKMDIHIQSYKTDIYKKSVINMGTKVHNKLTGYIIEIDSYKALKKELKFFFFFTPFTQWKNLYLYNFVTNNI